MADNRNKRPEIKISPGSSERAPFIYSDGAATFGCRSGIIEIELAASTIVPNGPEIKNDILIVAHLRCSIAAAKLIRDSIDQALVMSETATATQAMQSSALN